jgi:glutaminyl-tRNA synthetase
MSETAVRAPGQDFVRDIIRADLDAGRHKTVVTRFPPEPNGYLHIGHAKSICLNFGVAQEFGGRCHLRFDDTNPVKEEQEYIDAIKRDVAWLGFDWGEHLYHASDYFEQLAEWAEHLIRAGNAYIDDQSHAEMRATRGTLTEAGTNSPYRERSVAENLDLFARMRAGEFPNGARVLRAKIDMASGNINLRDPVLYRILHASHPRTGTAWFIYPSYDFAHGQSDAIEGITHSLCTLEFEDHRPLYDWFIENLPVPSRPRQYEFARLNLSYTVLSKRVLTLLVRDGHVGGWDDPRMPTLAGIRRRGVPPEALRDFVKRVGVARADSLVDVAMFEASIRELLNRTAGGNQQSRGSGSRIASHQLRPRALCRAGRLHGASAEEVLPALARQGGAAPLRLFHHLPRGGEECRRRGGRAPLHVRPRDARRQLAARRPQGAGDASLGVGGGFDRRRGPSDQSALHPAAAGRRQFCR